MRLPDLDSLRCFEAAAVALNFRRAARAVALPPAAFSDRIRQLEDQVGEPLFKRSTRQVALTVAGRIHRRLGEPYRIDGSEAAAGASVGVALFPEHATGVTTLMRAADAAMYQAKRAGGGVRPVR